MLRRQKPRCVRRRAMLTLRMHDSCRDSAEYFVREAFDTCYNDLSPYEDAAPQK